MKNLKIRIEDYIADFKTKSPAERKRALRKLGIEAAIGIIAICSPFIATHVDSSLEKDLRSRKSLELTTDEKWALVRSGRMRLECEDNTTEELRKVGLELSTPEGMSYALNNNLCDFALNQ